MEALRPNLVRLATYEEAAAAVAGIEAAEAAAAAAGEESDASDDSDADSAADGGAAALQHSKAGLRVMTSLHHRITRDIVRLHSRRALYHGCSLLK